MARFLRHDRCRHYWRRRTKWAWIHLHGTVVDDGEDFVCGRCRDRRIEALRRLAASVAGELGEGASPVGRTPSYPTFPRSIP